MRYIKKSHITSDKQMYAKPALTFVMQGSVVNFTELHCIKKNIVYLTRVHWLMCSVYPTKKLKNLFKKGP